MNEYLRFFRREWRLVVFGAGMTFLSSGGQTFLVSLFVPHFLESFALDEAGFGTLYSAATLCSALLLSWVGAGLDRFRLDRFTVGVLSLLALSATVVGTVTHVAALGLGLVGLRLGGQGLSSHTALTTMARYYRRGRGKALSLASLGFPVGEAVLPLLLATTIAALGWRRTWGVVAGTVVLAIPCLVWLLRSAGVPLDPREAAADAGENAEVGAPEERDAAPSADPASRRKEPDGVDPESESDGGAEGWARSDVLRDPRFWCVLPAALLPPFWVTGFFLYQTTIAGLKGWSVARMASAFVAFALVRVLFSLAVGGGIDRSSARRIFPYSVLPMGAGMVVLLAAEGSWAAYTFMGLLGVSMGISGNVKSALWAELYGLRHLGAIKSMMASVTVVSTAASPALVGYVLSGAPRLEELLIGGIASVVVGTLLAFYIRRPDGRAFP